MGLNISSIISGILLQVGPVLYSDVQLYIVQLNLVVMVLNDFLVFVKYFFYDYIDSSDMNNFSLKWYLSCLYNCYTVSSSLWNRQNRGSAVQGVFLHVEIVHVDKIFIRTKNISPEGRRQWVSGDS